MSAARPRTAASALRGERGVALLIVLAIVSLLTIIVTEFTYSVQIDQHRSRNAVHALQAQLLARSGVNIAEGFLMLDEEPNFDAYGEDWYQQLIEFCDIGLQLDESTQIRCRVRDESGKININNTRGVLRRSQAERVTGDAVLRDAMRCMFQRRGIDVDIVDKLADRWQQEPTPKTDGTPAQVPDFTSLEDFGSTFGIPTEQLRQLRPLLTAQPRRLLPTININTAPAEVLAAVLNAEDADCPPSDAVSQILERRADPDQPFRSAADISGVIAGDTENSGLKRSLFGVRSSLFRIEASARTNIDPADLASGGIGQTLSVLVSRQRSAQSSTRGATTQAPAPGASGTGQVPNWTLRPFDWQKEGGARLFRRADDEEEDAGGSPDDQGTYEAQDSTR